MADAAAIGVGPLIGAIAQELVDQIAIGGMDLDPIEARGQRMLGRLREVRHQLDDLRHRQRPRHRHWHEAFRHERLGVRLDRRGGQRRRAGRLQAVMGDSADMADLQPDPPGLGVHGVGDPAPPRDLLGRVNAGRVDVALAVRPDLGRFGDDQAGAGALGIVERREAAWHTVPAGAIAGERCHHDPIGQAERAAPDRGEQAWSVGLRHAEKAPDLAAIPGGMTRARIAPARRLSVVPIVA